MRLIVGAFALVALMGTSNFLSAPVSAQSAEQCRAEFVALYTQDEGYIYPYQIEVEETMSGYTTSGTTTVISPTHRVTDDGWGNLSEYNGRRRASSTDDGTIWNLDEPLPANHWADGKQFRRAAAEAATDVSCGDDVSFDGSSYRMVQGTTNHRGSELTETYYRNSAGIVAVREVSGSLAGTDFNSVDRTVAVGNDVVSPPNYR